MALTVAAGLLGLLGSGGPLSEQTLSSGSLTVELPRFVRSQSPSSIEIRLDASGRGDPIAIVIDRTYLRDFKISAITPTPQRARFLTDGLELIFESTPGTVPILVNLHGETRRAGRLSGSIRAGGGRVQFWQLSYP
jgi:hypothetical protein